MWWKCSATSDALPPDHRMHLCWKEACDVLEGLKCNAHILQELDHESSDSSLRTYEVLYNNGKTQMGGLN